MTGPPGRPGDGEGGPKPANVEESPHSTNITSHRQATGYCHSNGSTPPRRPADLFREGFRRGALDALRLASREFDDPAAWLVLSRLADRYGGQGDYKLAGGDS
jgi:hypothetical protein